MTWARGGRARWRRHRGKAKGSEGHGQDGQYRREGRNGRRAARDRAYIGRGCGAGGEPLLVAPLRHRRRDVRRFRRADRHRGQSDRGKRRRVDRADQGRGREQPGRRADHGRRRATVARRGCRTLSAGRLSRAGGADPGQPAPSRGQVVRPQPAPARRRVRQGPGGPVGDHELRGSRRSEVARPHLHPFVDQRLQPVAGRLDDRGGGHRGRRRRGRKRWSTTWRAHPRAAIPTRSRR